MSKLSIKAGLGFPNLAEPTPEPEKTEEEPTEEATLGIKNAMKEAGENGNGEEEQQLTEEEDEGNVFATQPDDTTETEKKSRSYNYEDDLNVNIYEVISEDSAEEALKKFMQNHQTPEPDVLQVLVPHSHRRTRQLLVQEDFDQALKYQNAHNDLLKLQIHQKSVYDTGADTKAIQDKIDELKEKEKAIIAKWDETIKKTKEEIKYDEENLQKKHEEECNAFSVKWTDENFLKKYSKPSPALIECKATQKKSVLARDVANAVSLKKDFDNKQKEGSIKNQQEYSRSMKNELNNLYSRQDREDEVFDHLSKERISKNEQTRDLELLQLRRTLQNLELQKNGPHLPKKVSSVSKSSSSTTAIPAEYVSPRTRKAYASYKKESTIIRVPVTVIDPKTILRPSKHKK